MELAIALFDYWRCRGLAPEGSQWLGKAVARAPAGTAARGRALLARGYLLAMQGSADLALADASRVIDLAAEVTDGALTAHGHLVATMALTTLGRLTEAADAGDEARRLLSALGDRPGLIDLDIQLTYLALRSGDSQAAFRLVERTLRQLGTSRERWLHASCYLQAALALYLAGRDTESLWTARRALRVKQETGDVAGLACALELLGWLAARAGSGQRAAWLLGAARARWERAGRRFAGHPFFEQARAGAEARCAGELGAERFAELLARGARQPLAATIAFALDEGRDPGEDGAAPRQPSYRPRAGNRGPCRRRPDQPASGGETLHLAAHRRRAPRAHIRQARNHLTGNARDPRARANRGGGRHCQRLNSAGLRAPSGRPGPIFRCHSLRRILIR